MSVFLAAWEQRKLGDIAVIFDGTHQTPKYTDSGIKFVSVENIATLETEKYISQKAYENEYSNKQAEKGDILMTRIGNIGTAKIIEKDEPLAYYVTLALLKPQNIDSNFLVWGISSPEVQRNIWKLTLHIAFPKKINLGEINQVTINIPSSSEQKKIGEFFQQLDSLIALHQRKPFIKNGDIKMITSNFTCDSLFKDYFEFWIKLYKEGAVRPVTLEKYRNNQKHIAKIIPNLKMKDFDRNAYQELLNQYALTHERQTVIDFHHQVKGAILDAVDDGLIDRDPTRKAIFKGKAPREKKQKYLNQFELHNLLEDLDLGMEITWDWLILLIAKTGLRFSEALGLTPADFDFARQTISVNKTWDYKTNTGFQPTKNRSSIRKVQMDWQLGMQFQHLIKNLNEDEPIFVNGPVCNSTPNNCLARHCRKCGIPEISIHGLRHTHASLLMFAGVSIASVSRRLGHSSITTTQKVYMHIISELENQDNDLVMRYLSSLS